MKKLVCFLAIAMLMAIPVGASATIIGNGQLKIVWSEPTGGGYYLDYDAAYMKLLGFTQSGVEAFCVSHEDAANPPAIKNYTFYTISSDLNSYGFDYTKLSKAAWIADNWTTWGTTDIIKGEAQKAVWKVTGVMDIVGADGVDKAIYNAIPANLSNYDFTGWAYANSPVYSQTTPNLQDFLVPVPSVPEPATMLLLGFGLIGLAGFGRKKLLNRV